MKILIGYDGSTFSDAAMDDLQHAGLPPDTQALVLSVADVWPAMPPAYQDTMTPASPELSFVAVDSARKMAKAAEEESVELARKARLRLATLFPEWSIESETVSDSPASALTERAENWKADLIAIGSHGRGALARMFFGSISQKVLRYAHCSVRIGRHLENRKPGPLRILLGLDTSPGAAAALDAVAGRVWPADTVVRLVTAMDIRLATAIPVVDTPGGAPGYVSTDESGWVRNAQNTAAETLRRSGLSVNTVLCDGDPKHVLLHEAEEWRADCIFVGAKGISRIERFLLGSVSSSIAARAHCSVEVIRFE
jgi:nucleotide-binding universal stress UspA family protein